MSHFLLSPGNVSEGIMQDNKSKVSASDLCYLLQPLEGSVAAVITTSLFHAYFLTSYHSWPESSRVTFTPIRVSHMFCPQCASRQGPKWHCSTGCGPKRSARATYTWRAATSTPVPSSGAPSTSTCVSVTRRCWPCKHKHEHDWIRSEKHWREERRDDSWQTV